MIILEQPDNSGKWKPIPPPLKGKIDTTKFDVSPDGNWYKKKESSPAPAPDNTTLIPDEGTIKKIIERGGPYTIGMKDNTLLRFAAGVWKDALDFGNTTVAYLKKKYYNINPGQSVFDTPENSNSSSNVNTVSNGIYTTKGDPYQYKIVNCVWYTKSLKNRGKIIKDWKSLEGNEDANKILDGRFPNARKKCKKTNATTTTTTTTTDNKPEVTSIDTTPANLPKWAECIKTIKNLTISQDSKGEELVIAPFDNDLGYFWEDMTFLYVSKAGNKMYGKWSCNNNKLVINTNDGEVWMSGSGWKKTPDKVELVNPEQNFGTSWTSPDEISGANEPKVDANEPKIAKSNPFSSENPELKVPEFKGYEITKPTNLNKYDESTIDNLENIINEVNSMILEQVEQTIQAPKDELNILRTNPMLKSKGVLEALCRTNNGTSKPVNVNGKIYFAGKRVTKKGTTIPNYLTYDGMVLERQGDSCNFTYAKDAKGVLHIKGIPYSDLDLQYTEVLTQFGINPKDYNADPYFSIDSITTDLKNLVAQGAVSNVFKTWNDMLTYYYPENYNDKILTPPVGKTTLNPPTNRGELSQYRVVNGRNYGLNYNSKDVVIYIPATASPQVSGGGKKTFDSLKCKEAITEYLSAAIRFQTGQDPSANPTINSSDNRTFIRGCNGANMYKDLKIDKTDLPDVPKESKIFKWFRGDSLSIKEASYLLSGKDSNLPAGKNPYLPFPILKSDMNESNVKISNLIKENLQQLSEEKNNRLLSETKIIQIRTKILTENRILKFKQPREKFFNEILAESLYFESQGFDKQLIKEEFWDTLKGLFGEEGSEAIFETFKEYMGKWLLEKLTPMNPDGWIGNIIVTTIGDLHIDDLPKLTDCKFLTKKIASSIGEGITRKIQHDKGYDGGISDIVRNGLYNSIDNTEMVKSLENGLEKIICPALSGIKTKLEDKARKMKSMALRA